MAKTQAIQAVIFKNFDDKEFVCSWDSVEYRFSAGQERYVEPYLADHFAKHLIDRVMHRLGQITSNKHERDNYMKLAIPKLQSISQEEAFDLNARENPGEIEKEQAVDLESKKPGRPKKEKKVEEEFIGLNEK